MKVIGPAIVVVFVIAALGAVIGRLSCAKADVQLLSPGVAQTNDNAELYVAVQKARRSLDDFISRYEHPKDGDRGFGVQGAFATSGQPEHIWIHLDNYKDGVFTGRLADEPSAIPGKHKGDTVDVAKKDVTDWIYESDGKKVGGFTIDALEGQANAAGAR
jgi:uncharacterized protein YegJ (DUF2314 family)